MKPTEQLSARAMVWIDRFRQAAIVLRKEGLRALVIRVGNQVKRIRGRVYQGHFDAGYARWREQHPRRSDDCIREQIATMASKPSFSVIVPVYNVERQWLCRTIQSVLDQLYPHWELCLVDDASTDSEIRHTISSFAAQDNRIHFQFNQHNQGIAVTSNDALGLASNDYVVLLDHDDELSADALWQIASAIVDHPQAGVFYSDEDKIGIDGTHESPFFKPDFSPELIESQNYISHLTAIKRSIVDSVGGFSTGFDGAQDYDLILRVLESQQTVIHIPRVLYHWRRIPGSTAMRFDSKSHAWEAGRKALQQHCMRRGIDASVTLGVVPGTCRIKRNITGNPGVSVIVPFRDQAEMLDACLTSLFNHTRWGNLEVIGIDNDSRESRTMEMMRRWQENDSRLRFFSYPKAFNFSAICNLGVSHASGDYVVLINNDIEITSPDWLEAMLEHAQRDEIGAVGAKLLYPDQTVQHAGIVIGIGGSAGHPFKTFPADHIGYYGRLEVVSDVSAVSAALLMVSRQKYQAVGGFDETDLAVAYNDVDFCLKLMERGWRNVFTPYCQATHHESASRGYEVSVEQRSRQDREIQALRLRWPGYFENGDPFYSPNLTLEREDYTLNFAG